MSEEPVFKPTGSSWSYIGRHWHGELSLPISFFVNVVAIGVTEFVIVLVFVDLVFGNFNPSLAMPLVISAVVVSCIEIVVVVWQVVGTWRSARRHVTNTGHTFYALLAETTLAIYVLVFIGQLAWITFPDIKSTYAIAVGEGIGSFRITLLNETEVEFAGEIYFGAAEALRKLLQSATAVQTIHLNSRGGFFLAAERLREVVREHKLDTYTRTECASACAFVFLGGKRRYIHHSGKLGFHRGSKIVAKRFEIEMVDDAVSFGVGRDFAEKAYAVPHKNIWFPKTKELSESKYVTHIANGGFAISGFGKPPERSKVKTYLLLNPRFAAAHEADQESIENLVDIFVAAALAGEPEGQTQARLHSAVSTLIEKYLPLVSDEALIFYASDTAELAKALNAVDPEACGLFLKPDGIQLVESRKVWSPDLLNKDMRRSVTVLRSSKIHEERKTDPVPRDVVETLYQKALGRFVDKQDAETARYFKMFRENPEKLPKKEYCSVLSAAYERIIELPKNQAAIVLRDLFLPKS